MVWRQMANITPQNTNNNLWKNLTVDLYQCIEADLFVFTSVLLTLKQQSAPSCFPSFFCFFTWVLCFCSSQPLFFGRSVITLDSGDWQQERRVRVRERPATKVSRGTPDAVNMKLIYSTVFHRSHLLLPQRKTAELRLGSPCPYQTLVWLVKRLNWS